MSTSGQLGTAGGGASAPLPMVPGKLLSASNTGLKYRGLSEAQMTVVGAVTAFSTNNQVIERVIINLTDNATAYGELKLNANGIILRDSILYVSGNQSVAIKDAGIDNTIEGVKIVSTAGHSIQNGIWGAPGHDRLTIRRCDISGCENAVSAAAGVTVEESYMHDLALYDNPTGHADVIESFSGVIRVRRNRLDMGPVPGNVGGATVSGVNCSPFQSSQNVDEFLVQGNYIDGGNTGVIIDQQSTGYLHYSQIEDNEFGGHTTVGIFGRYKALQNQDSRTIVYTYPQLLATPEAILWRGNRFSDSAADLSPNRMGADALPT